MSSEPMQRLCALDDIPDGDARGFLPNARREDRLMVVRSGDCAYAYLNTCPHNWRPLDWAQDKFLSARGGEIVCFAHGAHFRVSDGVCVSGVCEGERLIPVRVQIEQRTVLVPAVLPESPDSMA